MLLAMSISRWRCAVLRLFYLVRTSAVITLRGSSPASALLPELRAAV